MLARGAGGGCREAVAAAAEERTDTTEGEDGWPTQIARPSPSACHSNRALRVRRRIVNRCSRAAQNASRRARATNGSAAASSSSMEQWSMGGLRLSKAWCFQRNRGVTAHQCSIASALCFLLCVSDGDGSAPEGPTGTPAGGWRHSDKTLGRSTCIA